MREYLSNSPRKFLKRVHKTDTCWLWLGKKHSFGYGAVGKNGKIKTHRLSWQFFRGPIPNGISVLHKCDNPPCVNPDHLFLGTQADNMRDMSKKGRNGNPIPKGSPNPCTAKFKKDEIILIRELRKNGDRVIDIAKKFNVHAMTITKIVRGRSYTYF